MANISIVPPIDDSPEALEVFHNQICEILNPTKELAEESSLPQVTPTDVVGLAANAGFGSVSLTFADVTYEGHAYTLFSRSTDAVFANAIPVGSTSSNRFVDSITNPDANTSYYYWAINVNLNGDTSLNYTGPVSSNVSIDVPYTIDLLLGKLGYDEFKTGSFPVRTEDTLPLLPDANYPISSVILLTTNGRLYINRDNVSWSYKAEATDIESNAIIAGKIAAGALVVDDGVMQNGYIKSALIDEAEINQAQIFYLDANKINAGTVDVNIQLNAATIVGGVIKTTETAATAGGIVLESKTLTVYDELGNVRVKLGLL